MAIFGACIRYIWKVLSWLKQEEVKCTGVVICVCKTDTVRAIGITQ